MVDLIIAILIGVLIGVPVSLYAGFVSARVLSFYEIRSEAWEIVTLAAQPISSRDELKNASQVLERLIGISIKLESHGHTDARDAIDSVWTRLDSDLNGQEVTWIIPSNGGRTGYVPRFSEESMSEVRTKIHYLSPCWCSFLRPWININSIG